MILTPIAPDRLRRALVSFARQLADPVSARTLRRIANPTHARRARSRDAAAHHRQALRLARRLDMAARPIAPQAGFGWDGRTLNARTEAYVLLHEVAHYQLAAPVRRRAIEFGLGPGPETGERAAAERAATVSGLEREREEAMASLLGILWEAELGQPALASFLDQNWLEGMPGPGAPRHFEAVLARLRACGLVTASGRPRPRLRRSA